MSFLCDSLPTAEKGRGGSCARTILQRTTTTQTFLAGLSLFLLQYQGGKDMEVDRLPSSYYSIANTYTSGFLHVIQYIWEEHSSV